MYFYMKAFLLRQLRTKVTGSKHFVAILRKSYSKCNSLQYRKSRIYTSAEEKKN